MCKRRKRPDFKTEKPDEVEIQNKNLKNKLENKKEWKGSLPPQVA